MAGGPRRGGRRRKSMLFHKEMVLHTLTIKTLNY